MDPWNELRTDRALQLFGSVLCCCYLITSFFWLDTGIDAFFVANDPWCWPFFDNCYRWRLSRDAVLYLVVLCAFCSLIGALLFVLNRIAFGLWVLATLLLLVVIVVAQDFRFRANQVYMLSWITLVFLFLPSRRATLTVLLVSFYFWAGVLKLNYEWLSGAVLYSELWLIPKGFEVFACWFVVLLEMVLVWGLLLKRPALFWGSFALVLLFHVESFSQVTYWYPLLMFQLLAIFPLVRLIDAPQLPRERNQGGSPCYHGAAVFILFSTFQLLPRIVSVDPALSGTIRHVALHMFQARQVCEVTVKKRFSNGNTESLTVDLPLAPRMKCEPLVYLNWARNRCLEWRREPGFEFLEIVMDVRRTSDPAFTRVLEQEVRCVDDGS